jgi:hypothetical protein
MRKLILASAFALASFAALAADSRNPVLAATDAPAATATSAAAPAAAAETAKPAAAQKQATRSRKPARETDEHKARRIAAKYGVYW